MKFWETGIKLWDTTEKKKKPWTVSYSHILFILICDMSIFFPFLYILSTHKRSYNELVTVTALLAKFEMATPCHARSLWGFYVAHIHKTPKYSSVNYVLYIYWSHAVYIGLDFNFMSPEWVLIFPSCIYGLCTHFLYIFI